MLSGGALPIPGCRVGDLPLPRRLLNRSKPETLYADGSRQAAETQHTSQCLGSQRVLRQQCCVAQRPLQRAILARNARFWPTIWPTVRLWPTAWAPT